MILLIDNYDSFVHNLARYFRQLGEITTVVRNDLIDVERIDQLAPAAIVLSPGPCTPNEAGICLDLIREAAGTVPILGVCLGHQAIGQAFGGEVVRCHEILHGKLSTITHQGTGLFKGLPQGFAATRYHSLVVKPETLPDSLAISARAQSGVIMGLAHTTRPVHGVQFHPESIASEHGHALLGNFLKIAAQSQKEPA